MSPFQRGLRKGLKQGELELSLIHDEEDEFWEYVVEVD